MRLKIGFLMFVFLVSLSAFAQEEEEHAVVLYDPLFWRDELSLKAVQSRQIEEINSEFYESLRLLRAEEADKEELSKQLNEGLQERSKKIYDALQPKQRKRLDKIVDRSQVVTTAQ
jgi:hypothetical protein